MDYIYLSYLFGLWKEQSIYFSYFNVCLFEVLQKQKRLDLLFKGASDGKGQRHHVYVLMARII